MNLNHWMCPLDARSVRLAPYAGMTREAGFKCMFALIQCECVHDAICYAHGAAASPITEEAANEYLMVDERRQAGEYQSRPVQLETLTSFPLSDRRTARASSNRTHAQIYYQIN